MTHSRPTRTLFEWCSQIINVLWGGNCFNTTTFLVNSWAGLFKVVYPRIYGMSWRHFIVSMNPEFLAKFTLGGNVGIVVLIKWFYGETPLCTSPRLHFKLNAIHGHATWQHYSPSPLMLKIEKRRCQIARFTGGPCMLSEEQSKTFVALKSCSIWYTVSLLNSAWQKETRRSVLGFFHSFSHSFQTHFEIVPQIKPRSLPYTLPSIHFH